MIITRHNQHTAGRRRPVCITVFESIPSPVDTRPFAIPHGENAVVFSPFEDVDLLRTPNRGCGEVLINAWLKVNIVGFEKGLGLPERFVKATKGLAAIPRNKPRGV